MTKIWGEAFWKPAAKGMKRPRGEEQIKIRTMLLPVATLAAITVMIGLAGAPLVDLAMRAAAQLMNSEAYIHAVLGGPA
jgi:multicomponent Na+:H+ antiporter subunit D